MAELKTKLTQASVDDYLDAIQDTQVRQDCWAIVDIMQEATHAKPQMWGSSIVGFGSYHYKYASGREADWMRPGLLRANKTLRCTLWPGLSSTMKYWPSLANMPAVNRAFTSSDFRMSICQRSSSSFRPLSST